MDARPDDGQCVSGGGYHHPLQRCGGFAGKHKYVASTKGIASKGKITINSGNVTVRTSTPGAEGIEGKEGVVFNGGNIDVMSPDDAINANATIEFNGAHVIARSSTNDAVDSNPKGGFFMPFGGNNNQDTDPAIIIRGGMGEMPSVPSNEDAKQPTALLIGINIVKDEPVYIYDGNGKLIDTVTIPFSLRRSASLIGSPAFKVGNTYTVKTEGYEKTFTLNEPFTAVR